MHSLGTNVILGLLAGATIYIGLLLARWRRMPAALRPILALAAAGILVFLTIEVGYHAFESVETGFSGGHAASGWLSLLLVVAGFGLGLVALGVWEDRRAERRAGLAAPLDLAVMTAVGIGAHNFGEGLAIGQSYASGAAALGASLVVGFALHNATEGFGIVGGLGDREVSWSTLGWLGLIGGGPTVAGALLGGLWTSDRLVTFCYALAAGSLLYVVRELFRIPFKIPSRIALTAVAAGILTGLLTETAVEAGQMSAAPAPAAAKVDLTISGGKFAQSSIEIPSGAALVVHNADKRQYTLEGAGVLRGDVPVDGGNARTVQPLTEPGSYMIYAEEDPKMLLPVRITGAGAAPAPPDDHIVASAASLGRQPLVFSDLDPPSYVAYTGFDLTAHGEAARQQALARLNDAVQSAEADRLPPGLAQYFTARSWAELRPSVAVVVALGPGMFDAGRFGAHVAATRPADLHRIFYSKMLGFDAGKTQKDLLVRATSNSLWFNEQVCRYVWRTLGAAIARPTLDYGYANPNGRSPILGGFFDGTGNPIGREREDAVYKGSGAPGGTYLAWFKIRFDVDRFTGHALNEQQTIVGRVKQSGRQLPGGQPNSHRAKAEGDSTRSILRQAFVFDYGPNDTGLLFASDQASLTRQFEGIFRGYMMNGAAPRAGAGKDRLMSYMHFDEGGYYYVPPAPKGSYPGAI